MHLEIGIKKKQMLIHLNHRSIVNILGESKRKYSGLKMSGAKYRCDANQTNLQHWRNTVSTL